ncbi:MAG: helix-turn-helix transcriptional regulator [Arhodomonas sp.]|nr:helix-turn-helix transcriptional regulator [Arhodomonas sp.]
MSAHIDYRIDEREGRRFAVVPLEQFTALVERAGETDALTIPHEVVSRHLLDGVSLRRAWREYLGLTQMEVAERMGVTQGRVAHMGGRGCLAAAFVTKRIAEALGLHGRAAFASPTRTTAKAERRRERVTTATTDRAISLVLRGLRTS